MQNGRSARKVIAVASLDPWLDTLHGKSVLSLLINLAVSCNSHILLLTLSRLPTKKISLDTISVYRVGLNPNIPLISYVKYLLIVLRHLLRIKLDLMIIDLPSLPLYLVYRYLMGRKTLRPLVIILSRPVNTAGLRGFLQLVYFRFLLFIGARMAWKVTAISPYEALEFSRWSGSGIDRFIVLPSMLGNIFENKNLLRLDSKDLRKIREKISENITDESIIFLYYGALDTSRGVVELTKMFIRYTCNESNKKHNIYLVLIGDGDASKHILEITRQNKCKNVIFLGRQPYHKMPYYIAASDVVFVAFPFSMEWMYQVPTKLLEAMALGKVVIVTTQPGIMWTLSNYPYACKMTRFTYEEFSRAMNCALEMLGQKKLKNVDDIVQVIERTVYSRFSARELAKKLCKLIRTYIT